MVSGPSGEKTGYLPSISADERADEKYLVGKSDRGIDEYERFARENAKEIVAVGFNPDRTFIFSDYGFMGGDFYKNVTRVAKVCSNLERVHRRQYHHAKAV
jgi:tryptophanyl-tRNA synthetase